MAKDRSPKSPRNTLKSSVEAVAKLFAGAKRAPVSREAAAKTMGYAGITGVSATILGSLGGYGLIQKRGTDIAVSDLAISILHPTGLEQRKEALKRAALIPTLFAQLAEHYLEVDANVLTSKLVQMGFSPEAAKITAKVFLSNAAYAELCGRSDSEIDENEEIDDFAPEGGTELPQAVPSQNLKPHPYSPPVAVPTKNVLATYKIPLGSNEAEIIFSGETLEPEDFEALREYVLLFKKQFERNFKRTEPQRQEYQDPIAPQNVERMPENFSQ